jgi:hypothetical protein
LTNSRSFLSLALSLAWLISNSTNAGEAAEPRNTLTVHRVAEAWKLSRGAGTTVAVADWLFDSGPEAARKYVSPKSLVPGEEFGTDEPWHGEWMAAIVHEIAPEAMIMPIRARPPRREGDKRAAAERPYEKYLIEAIRYAADQGAVAVTNSMGPVRHSAELHAAVAYAESKGCVFIDVHPEYLAFENGAFVFCQPGECNPAIIRAGILSVTDHAVEPAANRDVYAWPYQTAPVFRDGWGYSNGPPTIAGVVALMKGANPSLSVREVKEILVRTAIESEGFRVLDAAASVREAMRGRPVVGRLPLFSDTEQIPGSAKRATLATAVTPRVHRTDALCCRIRLRAKSATPPNPPKR